MLFIRSLYANNLLLHLYPLKGYSVCVTDTRPVYASIELSSFSFRSKTYYSYLNLLIIS